MNVRRVHLEWFRNHTDSDLELGGKVNVLHGKNGQGKTNVLEALSCLCLTKSFYAANDSTLVQFGREGFRVEGWFAGDAGMEQRVCLTYARSSGEKVYTINGIREEKLSSVIGLFPVVILAPESSAITFGGPSDRRRFMDLLLSQLSRAYFDDLLEYRQVLRQRNRILAEARQGKTVRDEVLDPWDSSLASSGARIISRRAAFLGEFGAYVARSYAGIMTAGEEPELRYETAPGIAEGENTGQIVTVLHDQMKERRGEELRRGLSLVGPHRDDVIFGLNGLDLRRYASQGQHKTFLIALKMAEFVYLRERREETPLLLLDDVLSELDRERSMHLLSGVAHMGQTVVTTTDATLFGDVFPQDSGSRQFAIEGGVCRREGSKDTRETAIAAEVGPRSPDT